MGPAANQLSLYNRDVSDIPKLPDYIIILVADTTIYYKSKKILN
jgi:hypothetical protein